MTERIIVHGRVQGVGFRAFTCGLGESLGMDGAVWNTRSGEVEILARHTSPDIFTEFESKLRYGPGHVKSIVRTPETETDLGPGFEIRETR
ncbi:MAG: acylphosphatase [Fimbriimonadaceae bacterium]|nr:acylphosphatase [Fimbriimonadaceae bacterium]